MEAIKWRNLTITNVDWFKKEIEYEFDDLKIHTCEKFKSIWESISSTDELQAIKMIMDRIIVKRFAELNYLNDFDSGYFGGQFQIYKYILDIFKHPYEWDEVLLGEE